MYEKNVYNLKIMRVERRRVEGVVDESESS